MLLVETSNGGERKQLEEEFLPMKGAFQVPTRQSSIIAALLKSITF